MTYRDLLETLHDWGMKRQDALHVTVETLAYLEAQFKRRGARQDLQVQIHQVGKYVEQMEKREILEPTIKHIMRGLKR
jgi:hypothetical protein